MTEITLTISFFLLLSFLAFIACKPWKTHDKTQTDTTETLANRMTADAYWFSESTETLIALQLYAEGIRTNQPIESIRDKWREKCNNARSKA